MANKKVLNRDDIARALAAKTGLSIAKCHEILNALVGTTTVPSFGIIPGAILKGSKIRISGFGVFDTIHSHGREGRNPQTGEALTIESSRRPRFSYARTLRSAIRERFLGEVVEYADAEEGEEEEGDSGEE